MVLHRRGMSQQDLMVRATENLLRMEELAASGSRVPALLEDILDAVTTFKDAYQGIVGAWRIERARDHAREIISRRMMLDQAPPEIYLLRILTPLLQQLDHHTLKTEFLVRTSADFWKKVQAHTVFSGFTTDDYFKAQRDALSKGMRLQRVVCLGPDNDDADLQVHRNFLSSVAALGPPVSERLRLFSRRDNGSPGPLVCIRLGAPTPFSTSLSETDQACLVIHTDRAGDHDIADFQFLFSGGPSAKTTEIRPKLDEIYRALDGAEPIR